MDSVQVIAVFGAGMIAGWVLRERLHAMAPRTEPLTRVNGRVGQPHTRGITNNYGRKERERYNS